MKSIYEPLLPVSPTGPDTLLKDKVDLSDHVLIAWIRCGTSSMITLDDQVSYRLLFDLATTNGRCIEKKRSTRRPPPLSREERERRQGIPPLKRLVAIHDENPHDIGHSKVGKLLASVPVRRRLVRD